MPKQSSEPAHIRVRWLLVLGFLVHFGSLAADQKATWVGIEQCGDCHAEQVQAWEGSHHDLAMQEASEDTVLGSFDDTLFEHNGVATRFYRDGSRYMVETEGHDGQLHDFEISYTFGVHPLQQYLIGFPDGRYQALTIAWDSRDKAQGGQRWYHLYPDEKIPPGDELHWLAPAHNWNFSCAECHSTNLGKGYDPVKDQYATTWSAIDVSCEACHGPASVHVEAARNAMKAGNLDLGETTDYGLVFSIQPHGQWHAQDTGSATLAGSTISHTESSQVESCGRCHARRGQLTDDYRYGHSLTETHRVTTLLPDYYYPDGQINDEVYVYGSFRQSAMYAAGVVCSDCHNPHSLELRAQGDALCHTCHAPATYSAASHHHHETQDQTPNCVDCHMPDKTYMVVDPRRDHSFRVPRPDRSLTMGTPNACNQCHQDQTAQWASSAIDRWFGSQRAAGAQDFSTALHLARKGDSGAGEQLRSLILDSSSPAIARATALEMLPPYLSPEAIGAIQQAVSADDPLVRRASVSAIAQVDARARVALLMPLLSDPVLGVRVAAAEGLIDVRPEQLEPEQAALLTRAFEEYLESEQFNSDRAEHWVNLAGFYALQGQSAAAEKAFDESLRRNPNYVPAYANRADFYRSTGRDEDSEKVLRSGLERVPDSPVLHHALGLLLVRSQQADAALSELAQAVTLAPEEARFAYVYGVALQSYERPMEAIAIWRAALRANPNDQEILYALIGLEVQQGEAKQALFHAQHLLRLRPDDEELRSFVAQLAPQVQ